MPLIDKVFPQIVDGEPAIKISAHRLSALLLLLELKVVTRAEVIDSLELESDDTEELDRIIRYYSKLEKDKQNLYHSLLEALSIAAENGDISKAKYAATLKMDEDDRGRKDKNFPDVKKTKRKPSKK